MSDRDDVVQAVVKAWTNAGVAPDYHRRKQREVLAEWPVLGHALLRLVAEADAT